MIIYKNLANENRNLHQHGTSNNINITNISRKLRLIIYPLKNNIGLKLIFCSNNALLQGTTTTIRKKYQIQIQGLLFYTTDTRATNLTTATNTTINTAKTNTTEQQLNYYENFRKAIKAGNIPEIIKTYQELFDSEQKQELKFKDYNKAIDYISRSNLDEHLPILYKMVEDMKTLNIQTKLSIYTSLMYANKLHNKPWEAWRLFESLKHSGYEIVHVDAYLDAYSLLINAFKQTLNSDGAMIVFVDMKNHEKFQPVAHHYHDLIELFQLKGDVKQMEKLYDEMIVNIMEPLEKTSYLMINQYMGLGDINKALVIYKRILRSSNIDNDDGTNHQLDLLTYNNIIYLSIQENNIQKAMHFYESMLKNNIQPNHTTYDMMFNMWLDNDDSKNAYSIYKKMIESNINPNKDSGVIIPLLFKEGEIKSSIEIFKNEVQVAKEQGTTDVYYDTIKRIFRGFDKNPSQIKDFLNEVKNNHGIEIDEKIGTLLLYHYMSINDNDSLIEFYDILVNKLNSSIDTETYTKLIEHLIKSKRIEESLQVYYEARSKCGLNTRSYNIILDSFANINHMSEAQRIFVDMRRLDVKPNSYTYSALIKGLGKTYDYDGVVNFHNLLKMNLDVEFDLIIYNALMEAYNRCGYGYQVIQLWDLLVLSEHPIDDKTVSIVLDTCGYCYITYKIKEIWDYLKDRRFKFSINNYNSYIEALSRTNQFTEAKRALMYELQQDGFVPEEKTVRPLLSFLHDKSRGKDQFHIIDWIRREYPDLAVKLKFSRV
ncbi:14493_t:CDS:2 [Entrophospora sp. SA101]|nr:16643_t:CDS:2 [Entrophospora sp. SA101]CAJ0924612.1 14493_t:CDS:2 [Entrophospora sp. SA101]